MDRPIDTVLAALRSRDCAPREAGTTGRQWTCRCPAHDDRNPSCSVAELSTGRVRIKCFAGCEFAQLVEALGLEPREFYPGRAKTAPTEAGVTVNRLAFEKRLDADRLRAEYGVADIKAKGSPAVAIPYRDQTGRLVRRRIRSAVTGGTGVYWEGESGPSPVLYGLWLLESFRGRGGPLVVVEGESDCWALWSHGFNALGVPGATNDKVFDSAAVVAGFDRVIVWQEPGKAGEKFPGRVSARLKGHGYDRPVYIARIDGAKDPSDIQARWGAEFPARFQAILEAAKPVDPIAPPPGPVVSQTVQRAEPSLRAVGVCGWGEFEFNDTGNAGRLAKLHGADLRYVRAWGGWQVWDGRRWQPDQTFEPYRRADATVMSLVLEAATAPGHAAAEECLKHYRASRSTRAVNAMLALAQTVRPIPVEHTVYDADPFLLNCPNGTIDLRTGDLVPHRREDCLTVMAPTEYRPDAGCPRWERFLESIFPTDPADPAAGPDRALIGFVQRLLGYCLTGDVSAQVLPVFHGGGSNGKSTLLDVVQDVLGLDYSCPAPDGFLMEKFGEKHPTEVADLRGKRLVTIEETERGRRLAEGQVKKLTGGNNLKARFVHKDNFTFRPTHKLILCTNHEPRVGGTDHGIWRRLLKVPFAAKFWNPDRNETGPPHLRRDNGLKAKLLAESSGVLAWLVRGCLDWRRDGLREPDRVTQATAEYRDSQDQVGQFLADAYRSDVAGAEEPLARVWETYKAWCDRTGEYPVHKISRQLSADLKNRNYRTKVGHARATLVLGLQPVDRAGSPSPAKAFDVDELDR